MRGQVVLEKKRGCKNRYVVNNCIGPDLQIYAVQCVLCKGLFLI